MADLSIFLYIYVKLNNNPYAINKPFIYIEPLDGYFRYKHKSDKKDWHDHETIQREKNRKGPGEHGQPVTVPSEQRVLADEIFKENFHNGLVSDIIARDRSLPDVRPAACRTKKYLKDLPKVSFIIPFHNEVLSTLTRTIHSIFNRSPPELVEEVILVNDNSDKEHCYEALEDYIKENFDRSKIKILVMSKRLGLIAARLAGARYATGDVLLFQDCHTEVNVNFLPPLIEPIALDYRTVTCPVIDVISAKDYNYRGLTKPPRGAFNWQFFYEFMPLRPFDQKNPEDNFPSPVMMGCVFAISAKFFWELGGYDSALEIWGGEQYEMSFKTWLCHGQQIDVPCSRVGHLYRPRPFLNNLNNTDYCHKNFKRVAEVWMDEYAQYVYSKDPDEWNRLEVGDISYMKGIREKLKCKPFKYFLEVVAPDMLDRWPPWEIVFAKGAVQNLAYTECIDTYGYPHGSQIALYPCKFPNNLKKPYFRQTFQLRQHRDINLDLAYDDCLEHNSGKILLSGCSWIQHNQYFRYDLDTKQIFCGPKRDQLCMDVEGSTKKLIATKCDEGKKSQKWNWAFVNETMLRNWVEYGKPIKDLREIEDLK